MIIKLLPTAVLCSLRGVTSEGENCLKRDSVQPIWISFPVRDRVYRFVFILFPHRYRKIKWELSQGHRKTVCPVSVSRGCGLGTDCILWDFGHVLDSFCHSLEPPEKGTSIEVLLRSDWPVIMYVRGGVILIISWCRKPSPLWVARFPMQMSRAV